jgi:aldehyde dehydrogenase (NAD+)
MFTSWKLGPALAAGNTTVLKASELTPMTSLRLGELIAEAGFPPGVVNIVPGYGHTAGARLAEHPDVAKVSFTGSTETGRRIVTASAGNLKRLQLELGGKGANIVFADADIPAAVRGSAFAIFHNQGQACIAGSRLLLHEAIATEFLDAFTATARQIRIGHPLSTATQLGPLTSAVHRDRVLGHLKTAADAGATVLAGGTVPDDPGLAGGFYLRPTLVRADPDLRICHDEVFGPVVTVSTFRTEEEAIAVANGTEYGLGGGLWTADLSRAHRVAAALRSGMVWVNCYKRVSPGSPFGGTGRSGYGREMGFAAMDEYTTLKSVWINVDATLPDWYGA